MVDDEGNDGDDNIRLRVKPSLRLKIEEAALDSGCVKRSGEPNISEFVRKVLEERLDPAKEKERLESIVIDIMENSPKMRKYIK